MGSEIKLIIHRNEKCYNIYNIIVVYDTFCLALFFFNYKIYLKLFLYYIKY